MTESSGNYKTSPLHSNKHVPANNDSALINSKKEVMDNDDERWLDEVNEIVSYSLLF